LSLSPGDFQDGDLYSRKQWQRGKFFQTTSAPDGCVNGWILKRRNPAVNDLILVVTGNGPSVPCGHWLLGRVTKEFLGKTGFVCTAEVKTKNSTLLLSISDLYLLEESN